MAATYRDRLGDLGTVEAAVFDEDFVGVHAGHEYSRQVDSCAGALQRFGFVRGRPLAASMGMP